MNNNEFIHIIGGIHDEHVGIVDYHRRYRLDDFSYIIACEYF